MSILDQILPEGRVDTAADADYLERTLLELRRGGLIEEVPVDPASAHPLQEEHWYREVGTQVIYRFVPPNFPARGHWGRLSQQEPPGHRRVSSNG